MSTHTLLYYILLNILHEHYTKHKQHEKLISKKKKIQNVINLIIFKFVLIVNYSLIFIDLCV